MSTVHSAVLRDIRAERVTITYEPGSHPLRVEGLPEVAARETAIRLRAVEVNNDRPIPTGTLRAKSPEPIKRGAAGLDLAFFAALHDVGGTFFGELSLSGEVRAVPAPRPMRDRTR